jgi:hypothetical protein
MTLAAGTRLGAYEILAALALRRAQGDPEGLDR